MEDRAILESFRTGVGEKDGRRDGFFPEIALGSGLIISIRFKKE